MFQFFFLVCSTAVDARTVATVGAGRSEDEEDTDEDSDPDNEDDENVISIT